MKLLLDMNLPPKLVDMLISKGLEAKHWYEIGASDAPDTEIMSYALQNSYVVLTCDLDFGAILSVTHGQKPSVIQLRVQRLEPQKIIELVYAAVTKNANEIEQGAILSIDTKKARLRILPL